MAKQFLTICTTLTLAAVSAGAAQSYKVQIANPAWVGSTELKPGEYRLELEGGKAILKNGKNIVEVPAKAETSSRKHPMTALTISNREQKPVLREIRIGGTPTTIVFPDQVQ